MSSYVDIPHDAIVHVEEQNQTEAGKVRVFVRPNTKIIEVQKRHLLATGSSYAPVSIANEEFTRFFRDHPVRRAWDVCIERAERSFATAALEVQRLRGLANMIAGQRGPTDPAAVQMAARASEIESNAVGFLRNNLQRCAAQSPASASSVNEIAAEIIQRHLPA